MAAKETNNEWLSAVVDHQNYNKHHTKRKKKTPVGKYKSTPPKTLEFLEVPHYKNLHQTRVSSYFTKASKKNKLNSVKENKKIHSDVDYNTCKSNLMVVVANNEKGIANKNFPLYNRINAVIESKKMDDDALFGLCGNSLYETCGDIEIVSSDGEHDNSFKNVSDFHEDFNDSASVDRKELNTNELSPCIVSKYRKSNCLSNQSNIYHMSYGSEYLNVNLNNSKQFSSDLEININDSCTHSNKLTYRKHLLYDKCDDKCPATSNYFCNKNGKSGCEYDKASKCLDNIQLNVDDTSSPLTSIIPPSPIIFSGSFENSGNKDDQFIRRDTEEQLDYSSKANAGANTVLTLPSWPFTEENTMEAYVQNKGDYTGSTNYNVSNCSSLSGDYFHSCYNPPSPIQFTEN